MYHNEYEFRTAMIVSNLLLFREANKGVRLSREQQTSIGVSYVLLTIVKGDDSL